MRLDDMIAQVFGHVKTSVTDRASVGELLSTFLRRTRNRAGSARTALLLPLVHLHVHVQRHLLLKGTPALSTFVPPLILRILHQQQLPMVRLDVSI